uniref:Lipid scramblase CLPTM1L n=1 Tax=Macrostomum lignano TaxID=282301 RepID=A0A1I8FCC0_9PLAT
FYFKKKCLHSGGVLISLACIYVAYVGYQFLSIFYPKECTASSSTALLLAASLELYGRASAVPGTQSGVHLRRAEPQTDGALRTHHHRDGFRKPGSSSEPSGSRRGFVIKVGVGSESAKSDSPWIHWRSVLTINSLNSPFAFDRNAFPPELQHLASVAGRLPANHLSQPAVIQEADLVQCELHGHSRPAHLRFEPVSIGQLRLLQTWNSRVESLKSFGFRDTDIDDLSRLAWGARSEAERKTGALGFPGHSLSVLCDAASVRRSPIYSLMYVPHKSWYSWTINSMANSFNTFIDDLFAFIIRMPTAHRLACFRDDVIFIIYMYPALAVPVDKSRTNEFGQSFDEAEPSSGDAGGDKVKSE